MLGSEFEIRWSGLVPKPLCLLPLIWVSKLLRIILEQKFRDSLQDVLKPRLYVEMLHEHFSGRGSVTSICQKGPGAGWFSTTDLEEFFMSSHC